MNSIWCELLPDTVAQLLGLSAAGGLIDFAVLQ
jgi:hypothetical protein